MAKEIKVVVEQNIKNTGKKSSEKTVSKEKTQFDLLQKNYRQMHKTGATNQVENSTKEAKKLTKEIQSLLKVSEPTVKQLEQLRQKLDKFAALNEKLSKANETAAQTLKETIKQEEALKKSRQVGKKSFDEQHISKNKRKKEGDFKDPSIEQEIRKKKITYAEGPGKGKIVRAEKFMEIGATGNFSQFSEPKVAEELYELLIAKYKNTSVNAESKPEEIVTTGAKPDQVNTEPLDVQTSGVVSVEAKEVVVSSEDTIKPQQETETVKEKKESAPIQVTENPLKEKYQKQFDVLQADYIKAKSTGATGKVANSEVDIKALTVQIKELLSIVNPTTKDFSLLRKKINEFADINEKLGKVMGPVSKGLEETIKKEEELRKARVEAAKKVAEAQSVLAKKKTGEMGLKNSIIEEEIRKSGITYKSGAHAGKNVSREKFMEMGATGDFSKTTTPEVAAKLYQLLVEKQEAARADLQEGESELKKIDTNLAELESQKVVVNSGEEVILNAKSVKFENEKSTATPTPEKPPGSSREPEKVEEGGSLQPLGSVKAIEKQNTALGKAFKQFTLYNIALKAVKTALKEAVQTVKELDKYLTEQAMVTGLTREQTYGLVKSYQDLATQCGATTKEIAQVATEYMKQGKSIKESLVLTEAAVKAAKVARVSVGDSVNYLTTALNGFQLAASDAMKVSDKFAAVAASSATDYDELAIALSKVASQANLAGMSIDYTTALLTKGLETTREAPETMGTALKTIIARMRELGDYGETLEDGTDINNVESQLKYVGIALRDQQGELRSTEDVLDELGKKWDGLNKNQQAAIAKALAGTRQQARLIAMMEDYERVTELQEISQRSAGATAAQAGVYLEGMEASLNKIQVAWEKIVMTVTDSEVIIGIVSTIGDILDVVGDFLSTDFGLIATLSTVLTILTNSLAIKIKENMQAQAQQKLQNASLKLQLKERQEQIEELKVKLQNTKKEKEQVALAKQKARIAAAQVILEKKNLSEVERQAALSEISAAKKEYSLELDQIDSEYTQEINALKIEEISIEGQLADLGIKQQSAAWDIASAVTSTAGIFGGLLGDSTEFMAIMSVISGILQVVPTFIHLATLAQQKQNKELTKGAILSEAGGLAKFWPWGVFAAAALLAIVGISIAISGTQDETKKTTDKVNELSNEIYKLNEKANAINNITSSFDKLDGKLIKTNADLKEMSSLLDQAADKLTEDEQKDFNKLQTNAAKREYLETIEKNTRNEANDKRDQQIKEISKLSTSDRNALFSSSESNAIAAKDAVYAFNNNALYERLDLLKDNNKLTTEQASVVESFTQTILENMSAEQAWIYATDETGEKMNALVDVISRLKIEAKNLDGKVVSTSVGKILTSDDYTLLEQVDAFKTTRDAILTEYGKESDEYASFIKSFQQYEFFANEDIGNNLTKQALEFIDASGLNINKLNSFYEAWDELNEAGVKNGSGELLTQEVWEDRFDEYLNAIAQHQGDVLKATEAVFSDYLDGSEDTQNAFISAYGDLIQVGILNMGQNMDKIKNSINNFYERALDWSTMSESDKAAFIQDNSDLFAGEGGEKLLKAFESGNYKDIEEALQNNEVLQKKIQDQRDSIKQELLIETARTGKDRNNAYIKELEDYLDYLNDVENLFKASLEVRLEQEQKQLDEYRSMLEKEKEALTESLEKRKEAYEKYFDDIAQEEEDANYEEERDRLTTNIAKLASSSDADAKKQTMELEQQLKELEAERLKTIKERAREAILENMDNEVSEINEKFDKLLESDRALLAAMQGDLDDPAEFLSKMISSKFDDGLTQLQFEDYFKDLESTYGSTLDNVDWDSIREELINQLFLNVNGQDITLNEADEKAVYDAVKKALMSIGKR